MRIAFAALLIMSFVGIAVFGVLAMSHDTEHGRGCIAAAAQGTDCPENILPFLAFHFDTFKSFSTAVFGSMLLVLLVSLLVARIIVRILAVSPPIPARRRSRELLALPSFSPRRKLVRWLALHENSPAFL